LLKGTIAIDFRSSVFFHQTIPPRALIQGLKQKSPKSPKSVSAVAFTPLKPKMRSWQPPTFFCFNYFYGKGIIAIEIFLLDFPFTGRKMTCKGCLRFHRCHINFSGVIDTVEIVNDTAEVQEKKSSVDVPMKFFTLLSLISAVSMTPLKPFQRCQ
jgi:hypothetical protein